MYARLSTLDPDRTLHAEGTIRASERHARARILAAVSLAAGLGIAGCNVDSNFAGLGKSLLDPDAQGIESPGRRLVEGQHFTMRLVRSEVGERYVLSRTIDGELSILNLTSEAHCTIPAVANFAAIAAEGLPTWVGFITLDGTGAPELRFSDFACQVASLRVPTNAVPGTLLSGVDTGSRAGLFVRSFGNTLLLVDPWSGSQSVLQEQLGAGDPYQALERWWWRSQGQLVASDSRLKPVALVGSEVGDWDVSPELQELAYIENTEGARGLYAARPPDFTPELVAEDACSIDYLNGTSLLAYFSPCAERRLVLRDQRTKSEQMLSADVVSNSGTPALRLVRDRKLFLTNSDAAQATGTLWLVQGDKEPVPIGDNSRLDYRFTPDGGLLAVVDWTDTGGRLIYWKDSAAQDIAEGVYELGALGLLVNYDGRVGDLVRLDPDLSLHTVASGVPDRAAVNNALITNFDGQVGDLVLVDEETNQISPIASSVPKGAFGFGTQFDALIVLANRDISTNTSSLLFHLLDTGQDFVVNSGVTETREVSFPSAGLIYNVITGDAPGIYFAKVL